MERLIQREAPPRIWVPPRRRVVRASPLGGFGFGFGTRAFRTPGEDGEVFDPATLALTGWWRASYAASPWPGTASAGGSGSRAIEGASAPSVGTAQNGLDPADFNGSNDVLTYGGADASDLIDNTSGTFWALFKPDTAAASQPAGSRIDNPGVVGQDGGSTTFGLGFSDVGFSMAMYDGSYKEIDIAAAVGSYHFVLVRWNGSTLEMGVDSGSMQSIACAGCNVSGGQFIVGKNYNSAYVDGQMLEVGVTDLVLDDSTRSSIRSYLESRYALSL